MASSHCYVLQHDAPITFYPDKNQIELHGEEIHLEPLQARLLHYFIENRGKVVKTQQIAADVWQRRLVSDNLVRQVISLLRSQLQDKSRPYRIIQTIPKQGYLFDLEVTQSSIEVKPANEEIAHITPLSIFNARKQSIAFAVIAILTVGLLTSSIWQSDDAVDNTTVQTNSQSAIIPVYIHDITLDSNKDYEMAESIYNYLFYGLNSAKNLSGYHFSQLTADEKQSISDHGVEIKSWLKQNDEGYVLNVLIQNNHQPSQKVEKTFSQEEFFDAIGDVILEIKTIIAPVDLEYEMANHRVTAIDNYDDWKVISEGISLFYQGKGGQPFSNITLQLDDIQQQGRGNYLVNALLSYSESLSYLNHRNDQARQHALQLAKQAFEMNPRCDIANLTLGLALLINQQANQAFPYLFYAAESTPSPISFYLLSVVEQQSDNPKGSKYNYQRYIEMNKEKNGQLFDLIESSQKSNLFQTDK
ncbi:transcriptional regulator [Vibrio sp. NTOU-M3]|uniref:winged helix-turn-helix domain-containing protein n=1 Tax=Vibrio sp. NTOU-M3 TaxID=3234954 RepID=UPI00349F5F92